MKKIEVKTSAGMLVAQASVDPGAPGICLYMIPNGSDCIVDLAFAEVKEDDEYRHDGETKEDVSLYIYDDLYTEEWTKRIDFKRDDIVEALELEEDDDDE